MSPLFYKDQEKVLVSVDCLILGFKDGKLYLLITKRKFEPLKGKNSLMGGFLRSDENLSDTVKRTVFEYTGLNDVYMEQVGTYGDIGRDSGERVISIAYYALIDLHSFNDALCTVHNAVWKEIDKVGELVFDHNIILKDTLDMLKIRASNKPIGFKLLPEKFTLPQLQSLYEAIYRKKLDKRNFRKKILDMDILEKQSDKDKSNSKKGAFYYKFNMKKYDNLMKNGYFSI